MFGAWTSALLGVSLLGACQVGSRRGPECLELPSSDSPVIARIGSTPLTTAQIEKRLREQGSAAHRYSDAAALRRFIEDQVRFELLVQAAFERGLDRDPDVIEAARKVMVRKLLQQDLSTQDQDQASDTAIRAYYESHLQDYQQPERRRVAHIELGPSPDGRALSQSLIDRLLPLPATEALKQFRALAENHSLDKDTRGRGGEFNSFVSREELAQKLGPNFADEAFRLSAGDVSPSPVQSTHGWHLLYIIAKRDSVARSIDEVRDEIRDRLLSSDRAQLFDRYLRDIRQRYPVALYEDQLPELTARLSGAQKPTP